MMTTPTVNEIRRPLTVVEHDDFADQPGRPRVRRMRRLHGDSTRTREARQQSIERRAAVRV